MHGILDVAFQEDDRGLRQDQAPPTMIILRCIALHVLPHAKIAPLGIANPRRKAAWEPGCPVRLRGILLPGNQQASPLNPDID